MVTPVQIPPPMPTETPTVHLVEARQMRQRTLKGDLGKLKIKALAAKSKWSLDRKVVEGRKAEVREQAEQILAPVKGKIQEERKLAAEVLRPVLWAAATVRRNLDPAKGQTRPWVTSFMFSSIACWVIGPQFLVALYDRIVLLAGRNLIAPAHDVSVLTAGRGTSWGIMFGPGRWFRDTVGMAYEADRIGALVWAAILGLLPMIILFIRNMAVNHLATASYRGKLGELGIKWLSRTAYLVPVIYLVGISYPELVTFLFGSPWTLEWWQIWVSALFCSMYYAMMWVLDRFEKRLPLGITHVVLMTPLASIVTGFALHAPGAAW